MPLSELQLDPRQSFGQDFREVLDIRFPKGDLDYCFIVFLVGIDLLSYQLLPLDFP